MMKTYKESCFYGYSPEEEKILAYCKENNMNAHFSTDLVFITTPFGSWYFSISTPTKKLYHRNFSFKNTCADRTHFQKEYHKQNKAFQDSLSVLAYIKKHDFNKLERDLRNQRRNDIFKGVC